MNCKIQGSVKGKWQLALVNELQKSSLSEANVLLQTLESCSSLNWPFSAALFFSRRFSKLETRVSKLETRCSKLETRVSKLETSRRFCSEKGCEKGEFTRNLSLPTSRPSSAPGNFLIRPRAHSWAPGRGPRDPGAGLGERGRGEKGTGREWGVCGHLIIN